MMLLSFFKRKMADRADKMVDRIRPFVTRRNKILDLGAGNCLITKKLISVGYKVTPLDVGNKSIVPGLNAHIYNGNSIPYPDRFFDAVILITVLHHTKEPEQILKESVRVGKKIIIMETTYRSLWDKLLIVIFDSLVNTQFIPHWSSYRSEEEWRKTFRKLKLHVKAVKRFKDKQIADYFHILFVAEKV